MKFRFVQQILSDIYNSSSFLAVKTVLEFTSGPSRILSAVCFCLFSVGLSLEALVSGELEAENASIQLTSLLLTVSIVA